MASLTSEVKGEIFERASRFVGVAAEDVRGREPLDEIVAAFGDLLITDGFQLHLEGDAGIGESVLAA